jgi:uncharacterized membrane protein
MNQLLSLIINVHVFVIIVNMLRMLKIHNAIEEMHSHYSLFHRTFYIWLVHKYSEVLKMCFVGEYNEAQIKQVIAWYLQLFDTPIDGIILYLLNIVSKLIYKLLDKQSHYFCYVCKHMIEYSGTLFIVDTHIG